MNEQRSTLVAHCGATKIKREELQELPMPEATKTHQPIAHFEVVRTLEESLSYRHLQVVRDEYAVSHDGMKMFGVMDLDAAFHGGRFSIGLRNSNDKSMRLALTAGYRVFVCDNMAFSGDFTPLLHKHTSNFNLMDAIAVAVDRIHRGLETLGDQITEMRRFGLSDNDARLLIYGAFMEKAIKGVPKTLMSVVHERYFQPEAGEFEQRSLWSLSNAFTSAFKSLGPLKQFEATAKLGAYLNGIQADRAKPLVDCGTGRFRLVETGDNKFEEEMIGDDKSETNPGQDDWDPGDLVDSIIEGTAAKAAA